MGSLRTVFITGKHQPKMDKAGRFPLPSKWRPKKKAADAGEEEEEGCYMAIPNFSLGCVTVYPPKKAQQLQDKLDSVDLNDPEQQQALMDFTEFAQSFVLDNAGRMKLDDELLQFAGISKGGELVCFGNVSTFTIWSVDKFEENRGKQTIKEKGERTAASFRKLGVL